MATSFPPPNTRFPVVLPDGAPHEGTVFLNAAVDHPNWDIGDYTYASAFDPPEDWAARLAPWLYPGAPERLKIGKFGQIADGVRFVTASANHRFDGLSSYPFGIFDGFGERPSLPKVTPEAFPDTVVGHDVWIGTGAMILPGARIGNGAIIAAGAVVAGTVADYTIVGGNPARVIRPRISDRDADRMNNVAWWDWPIAHILAHEAQICGGDIDALEASHP